MKKLGLSLVLITAVFFHAHAHAHGPKAVQPQSAYSMCRDEAFKVIEQYNSELYDRALEQAKIDLEPGDEINMDALPTSPSEAQDDGTNFDYTWGENEECVCGATVRTTPASDGKSCKAEVDEETYGCDCG